MIPGWLGIAATQKKLDRRAAFGLNCCCEPYEPWSANGQLHRLVLLLRAAAIEAAGVNSHLQSIEPSERAGPGVGPQIVGVDSP